MKYKGILFGYGRAGKIHYKNILNSKYFELSYVVDINDISKNIDSNIEYINYENKKKINSILKQTFINFIIICTPTILHDEIILLGLDNNKHIFVEKPITNNISNIEKCFNIAEKKNLILFVGYNRRFDPKIKKIKKDIDNNTIGKINYVLTISRDYPYPKDNFLKICGGIFHDCATHDIDYVNYILNDVPDTVYVNVENNNTKNNNYEHVCINFKYKKGTIVCLNLSRIALSYDQRCEFYGENGEIINNIYKKNKKISFQDRYKKAFINEIKEFYKCIKNNKQPSVKKNDCINNHKIAEACEQSIILQKKIKINYK